MWWISVLATVVLLIILKRNDVDITYQIEWHFNQRGWNRACSLVRMLAKTLSLSKSRQKSELAAFIRAWQDIEQLVQRQQYFAERTAVLEHPLTEEQEWVWEKAVD